MNANVFAVLEAIEEYTIAASDKKSGGFKSNKWLTTIELDAQAINNEQ